MSTINTYNYLGSSSYLASQKSAAAEATAQANVQAIIADPVEATDLSAYLLDLSPQAQNYLTGSVQTTAANFTLSKPQQEQLDAILAKYEGAPDNDETLALLQADLEAAGLSPEQLAQQEAIKNFNPTQLLIEALSGVSQQDSQALQAQQSTSKYDTQKTNYIQMLANRLNEILAPAES